jgi:prepilin-type processing-associated H-X9-DG protein
VTSMRQLNRRLARWHRYARRTYWNPRVSRPAWMGPNTAMADGHVRARNAREAESERRFWDETPEIWLGGPAGEAALIADVLDDDEPYCVTCCGPCRDDDGHWETPDDDAGHGDDWPPP